MGTEHLKETHSNFGKMIFWWM